MANWKYRILIKDHLTREDDLAEDECITIAASIRDRLNAFVKHINENNKDDDEETRRLADDMENVADMFFDCMSVEDIDDALGEMYDVCDRHMVWVD